MADHTDHHYKRVSEYVQERDEARAARDAANALLRGVLETEGGVGMTALRQRIDEHLSADGAEVEG